MTFAALRRAAGWLPFLAVCGGCATLPGPHPANPANPAADSAAGEPLPIPGVAYRLQVEAPAPLESLLLNHLDLARFRTAPTTARIDGVEVARLVAAAPAQVRALLETEGYFNAKVRVERLDDGAGLPWIRIVAEPGPRATVAGYRLEATGELATAAARGDAAAATELAELRRNWPLQAGTPFQQAAWNEAKNNTLATLRAHGYPAASWASTAADVDVESNTVRLIVSVDSGALFRLGAIEVSGIERYDAEAVRQLSTFAPGAVYREKLLLDYQERLLASGLFEGAVVELQADPASASAAPVRVKVKELTLQQATFGLGYSGNTGARVTLAHAQRRTFGGGWIAHSRAELGPDLKSLGTEFSSYPSDALRRDRIGANAERLRAAGELRTSWAARLGRGGETSGIERLYFLEVLHARTDSAARVSSGDAVSASYRWVLRNVDSLVLPSAGWTVDLQTSLGLGRGREHLTGFSGEAESRSPFARAFGRLSWHLPLGDSFQAALRLEGGRVFARSRVSVPDPLLFRAGGDESVRGYGYRTLGPAVNGAPASGRVLLTASAELSRPISASYPEWHWAAFVDGGQAADRWQDLSPVLGYGLGLRWHSRVGPLRVDVARGHDVRQTRLHASLGFAF